MSNDAVATILRELAAAGAEMRECAERGDIPAEYRSEGAAAESIVLLMGA
ncbi:hypothetical protein [Uliginosibacterium sp. 31-12]|nr:hypothetical protein [Uliginosibacterium sp. 31-12]MDO6385614.1 hypothetical protein [Uliginosibacterium sp. 31-12]